MNLRGNIFPQFPFLPVKESHCLCFMGLNKLSVCHINQNDGCGSREVNWWRQKFSSQCSLVAALSHHDLRMRRVMRTSAYASSSHWTNECIPIDYISLHINYSSIRQFSNPPTNVLGPYLLGQYRLSERFWLGHTSVMGTMLTYRT